MKKTVVKYCILFSFCLFWLTSFSQVNLNLLNIDLQSPLNNGFNISCFGGKNGVIDMTITNGTAPYNIHWSNGMTIEDISGLGAGYYHVEVIDSAGQAVSAEIMLSEPKPWNVELWKFTYPNEYNTSCFDCFDVSIR